MHEESRSSIPRFNLFSRREMGRMQRYTLRTSNCVVVFGGISPRSQEWQSTKKSDILWEASMVYLVRRVDWKCKVQKTWPLGPATWINPEVSDLWWLQLGYFGNVYIYIYGRIMHRTEWTNPPTKYLDLLSKHQVHSADKTCIATGDTRNANCQDIHPRQIYHSSRFLDGSSPSDRRSGGQMNVLKIRVVQQCCWGSRRWYSGTAIGNEWTTDFQARLNQT